MALKPTERTDMGVVAGSNRSRGRTAMVIGSVLAAMVLAFAAPALGATAPATAELDGSQPQALSDYERSGSGQSTLVYGGFDAQNPGWLTAVFQNGSFICSGSLIDPQAVLTAAHCVADQNNYSVRVGSNYLYSGGIIRGVTAAYIHPGWAGNFDDRDLAILTLASPVTSVTPGTLNATAEWPVQAQDLTVAGWGEYFASSGPSSFLQAADVLATSSMNGFIDTQYCDLDSSAAGLGGMFCFGGPVDATSCSGDSGGPLIGWSTPSATGGSLAIYGTVSYGPAYCGDIPVDAKAQSVGGNIGWIRSAIDSIHSGVSPVAAQSVGLIDPVSGLWHLYDEFGALAASFYFGNPGDVPIYGDWDCDGYETPGLYRQSDGYVYLRNSNSQGIADRTFFFGNPGDVPLAGDFNADGCDTVSIYRPDEARFYIVNQVGADGGGLGAADVNYVFGDPGDKPFVGDFNGNGEETVGLHRESTGLVYYRNTHTQGNADGQFIFGDPGDWVLSGDWTANGIYTPALFRPWNTTLYTRYTNSQGNADMQWTNGGYDWLPVAGYNGIGAYGVAPTWTTP